MAESAAGDGDTSLVDAWIVLAKIAEDRGDTQTADQLYRRTLETLQNSDAGKRYADTAIAYSLVLRRRGDTEGALTYALEAAQAAPRSH